MGVVPGGTVWLFTNETKVVSETTAPFNRGEVQGVDVHGVWILNWLRGLRMTGGVWLWCLGGSSSMDGGDLLSDFSLEIEMGGFLIPAGDGGGDGVHSLDTLHNPNWDSG